MAWQSCATASGAITNLNGLTTSSQTFATGTATGIGLNIVSSGSVHTFTPTVSSGYNIPLFSFYTEWSVFYNTPSTRITAGTGLSWSTNTLNASNAFTGSGTNGQSAYWTSSTGLTSASITLNNGAVVGVNATSSTINLLVQGTGSNIPFKLILPPELLY